MSGFLCSMVGASFTVAAAAEVLRSKKGITAVGNAQVDTAQSNFGGASALFDGTGDYLSVAHHSSLSLADYSNWTIECWARLTEGTSRTILNKDGVAGSLYPGYTFYTNGSKQVTFGVGGSADNWVTVTRSSALADNTWYHLAGVKNGSTITFYVNGVSAGTATFVAYADQGRALYIGWEHDGAYMYGHIDETRISNSARYTTTFTPSTSAFVNDANTVFLMHANGTDASTFFEDDNGVRSSTSLIATGAAKVSTTQSKFGGSSANFDGSSNTQVLVRSWDTSSYTGDFTIEGWFYITDKTTSTNARVWSDGDGGTTEDFRLLQFEYSTNQIYMVTGQSGNDSWSYSYVSATLNINTWYHIAASRSGSSLRIFVNGTQQGSTISNSLAFTSASSNHSGRLGMFRTDASRYRGFIDDFRISNSARYTTTFTPSTTPFVNDSNTLLLMHADGTNNSTLFRDDNGTGRSAKAITAIGNAQIDTAQSKFGGASLLMDGNGDRLNVTGEVLPAQYTVEYWFRLASFTSAPTFVDFRGGGADNYSDFITTGGVFTVYINSSPIVTSALSTNTWYHIAVVRDSSSDIKLYLNGTKTGVTLNDANYSSNTSWYIGDNYVFANSVNGHMDEIRVSNTARYTANFSVATAPFQNDANTVLLLHCDGTDGSTVFTDDNGIAPYTP